MKLEDYYSTLGVKRGAGDDEIKRAYRKLARKYHPDVSKEADAEARFKEVREAYEVLSDAEKRAAYDDVGRRYGGGGQEFHPPPGWNSGVEFSGAGGPGADFGGGRDFSEFFESLFGRPGGGGQAPGGMPGAMHGAGGDHHARIVIDLVDAYRGARRTLSMRVPVRGADGHVTMQERQLDVNIPKGVRAGQHLRLAGQGAAGHGGGAAGDLYLEVEFAPDPRFRVDGRDIYLDLPLAPWEAALGALLAAPTPDGSVQLSVPKGSSAGRKLRLKGKGLPGNPPGDMYVVLSIAVPAADGNAAVEAYEAFARVFPAFNPRRDLEV